MDEAVAMERLMRLVDASSDPELDTSDVWALLREAKRPDAVGNLPSNVTTAPTWAASTAYSYGTVVTASPAAGRWWMCVQAGTSAVTQPSWPDITGPPTSTQVADGDDVVWADVGGRWAPTWDLDAAAVRGWELKMSRVAGRYDFITDAQTFNRGQMIDHFETMADRHRRRGMASIPTPPG